MDGMAGYQAGKTFGPHFELKKLKNDHDFSENVNSHNVANEIRAEHVDSLTQKISGYEDYAQELKM